MLTRVQDAKEEETRRIKAKRKLGHKPENEEDSFEFQDND